MDKVGRASCICVERFIIITIIIYIIVVVLLIYIGEVVVFDLGTYRSRCVDVCVSMHLGLRYIIGFQEGYIILFYLFICVRTVEEPASKSYIFMLFGIEFPWSTISV